MVTSAEKTKHCVICSQWGRVRRCLTCETLTPWVCYVGQPCGHEYYSCEVCIQDGRLSRCPYCSVTVIGEKL